MGSLDESAPRVLLAPMAGVTDLPFRKQAQAFGAKYCVSEMVASDQLAFERRDVVRRAAGAGIMRPLVVQIAGREAKWMTLGAQLATEAGADVIDINMGCPAKMVTNGASGSALMRDPDHAARLIEATVAGTKQPVTLKMRLGWDDAQRNAPELARRAEDAGVRMLTVHGRTRCQFYTGAADWDAIRAVVDAVKIPVIANGDIGTAAQARDAMHRSGAHGVMVGRAAQGKPWLPGAVARALEEGGDISAPPRERMLESLLELYDDTLELYGPKLGARVARKHIAWTIDAHFPNDEVRARRKTICVMEDPRAVRGALIDLFLQSDAREAA